MTDVIKGSSGFGKYLFITRANADRLTADKNGLIFYSTDSISEFDQVFDDLGTPLKLELSVGLNRGGAFQSDGNLRDSFIREEFRYGSLQLYVTGSAHYTSPSFLIKHSDKCNYYLAPSIDILQNPAVRYMDFSRNESGVDKYFEKIGINESEATSLVDAFYDNARNIYAGKRVHGQSSNSTGVQQLKDVLALGDAVIIQKHKSMYAPIEEIVSEALGVAALRPRVIDEKCEEIDVFIIKCEHYPKTRSFQLDVITGEPNLHDDQYVLQVVAQTDQPETVTVEYDKATCVNDDSECPSIVVDGGDYHNQRVATSPFKLKVKALKKNEDPSFMDFMKSYFLPDLSDLKPEVYTITTGGCSDISGQKALVHCFPTFEWGGKIEAGMEHKYDKAGLIKDRVFSIGGELKYMRNGSTTTFGSKSTNTNHEDASFPKLESMLTSIVSTLDGIRNKGQKTALKKLGKKEWEVAEEAGSDNLVNVTVTPPKIALGGVLKLAESTKTGDVGMAGEVALDLGPLIGVKVDTDLLDWLIMTFSGGLGVFLLKVKGLAARSKSQIAKIENSGVLNPKAKKDMAKEIKSEEGKTIFDAELYVKFIADGSISAKCEWKKSVDDSWLSVEGDKTASASAKITFKLEAVAKAKAEVFCVKISIGAEMHVAGAKNSAEGIGIETTLFATTAENKPTLGGNIRFTGMAIYYTAWAEIGVKKVESDDGVDDTFDRDQNDGEAEEAEEIVVDVASATDTPAPDADTASAKKQYDKRQIIFSEHTWPAEENVNPLVGDGL